jgi:hypothetical protein
VARGVGGVSPANIMKHLGGIDFPADREKLIEHAREKGKDQDAPDTQEVVDFLEQLPSKTYESAPDVLKAVGEKE